MDVSINNSVLDELNADAKSLHDIAVKLSSCGVGKIVDLPQIAVVGKQSAGKSSVLEAISHIRFPAKADVCTRFATELVLRHADRSKVDISVKFYDFFSPPKAFQREGFKDTDLPSIIEEAKDCMGISPGEKGFSKDVLRIEIEGPDLHPLTLIDLPGLYHTETAEQSREGRDVVNYLVDHYLKQSNTLILVVVAASGNLVDQAALERVRQYDPQRQRTIGVITKPDQCDFGMREDEKIYLQLAQNMERAHTYELGWFVVRNRTKKETLEDRDKNEDDFFKTGEWSSVPSENRGIANLRKTLSHSLCTLTRNSMPKLINDIEGKLQAALIEDQQLGPARSDDQQKRAFLLKIAEDFQRIARDAVHGRYSDSFFGDLDAEDNKLRAQLRNLNAAFDHVLKTRGSAQTILGDEEEDVVDVQVPRHLQSMFSRGLYEGCEEPEVTTIDEVNSQLQTTAASNQGREFPGCPNEELVVRLFKKQAEPWEAIARYHIREVIDVAYNFISQLVSHIVGSTPNNTTAEVILSTIVAPFFESRTECLESKLKELIHPYTQGYAVPIDADFLLEMSHLSVDRLATRITEHLETEHDQSGKSPAKAVSKETIRDAISGNTDLGDGGFGTDRVIDMMETFYQMSRRTFTDNVVNLAIESCLISKIPGIFSPLIVNSLSKEQLTNLAGESAGTVSRRKRLQEDIDILKKGLSELRQYQPVRNHVGSAKQQKAKQTQQQPLVNHSKTAKGMQSSQALKSHNNATVRASTSSLSVLNGNTTPAKLPTGGLFPAPTWETHKSPGPKSSNSTSTGLFGSNSNTSPGPNGNVFEKPGSLFRSAKGSGPTTTSNGFGHKSLFG